MLGRLKAKLKVVAVWLLAALVLVYVAVVIHDSYRGMAQERRLQERIEQLEAVNAALSEGLEECNARTKRMDNQNQVLMNSCSVCWTEYFK